MWLINQGDKLARKERQAFINWLERLPEGKVVVFTSVNPITCDDESGVDQLGSRLSRVNFEGSRIALKPSAEQLINQVWTDKGGIGPAPTVEQLEDGKKPKTLSFRMLLKQLELELPIKGEAIVHERVELVVKTKRVYPKERKHYLACEAATKVAGTKITRKVAYQIIQQRTSEVQALHPELSEYSVDEITFDSWRANVRKGKRAF